MSTVAALQGRTALAHNVCRQRAKILAGKTHHAASDGSLVAMTYHTPPKNLKTLRNRLSSQMS